MASAAQDLRDRRKQGMVDGSLAHDLDWVVRERELERAGELPRRRSRPRAMTTASSMRKLSNKITVNAPQEKYSCGA